MEDTIRVLVVEDQPNDAAYVRRVLEAADGSYETTWARTLADGLQELGAGDFDVILIDLTLPDSEGIATHDALRKAAPHTAGVVFSGTGDLQVAEEAVRRGAQDYISKNHLEHRQLERALRYAVARQELLNRTLAEVAADEREVASWKALEGNTTSETRRAFGDLPLEEAAPETFEALVEDYAAAVRHAAEQRPYDRHPDLNGDLAEVAHALGRLRASPREVIRLHSVAMRRLTTGATAAMRRLILEEGRLRSLELMGLVAQYYRLRDVGGSLARKVKPSMQAGGIVLDE